MKKICTLIMIILVCIFAFSITGCNNKNKEDNIGNNELKITYINQNSKTLKVSQSVKTEDIVDKQNIVKLEFGEGILSIENYCFAECINLKDLSFNNTLLSIGDYSFYNCKKIENITIPNNVTSIGFSAFNGCENLRNLSLPFTGKTNNSTHSEGLFGYIFGAHSFTNSYEINQRYTEEFMVQYSLPKSLNKVTLTNSTNINFGAFSDCQYLENIIINDNLINIDDFSFYNCISLNQIILPEKLEHIGYKAFFNCKSLQSLKIPDSVKNMDSSIISSCSSLVNIEIPFVGKNILATANEAVLGYLFGEDVYEGGYQIEQRYSPTGWNSTCIPESLKKINVTLSTKLSYGTFYNCKNLKEINLPLTLEKIESSAFNGCESLNNINIPDNVQFISSFSFARCKGLESISLPFIGTSKASKGIDSMFGIIFGSKLEEGFDQLNQRNSGENHTYGTTIPKLLKNITITNSTTIPAGAFSECKNIEYINFTKQLTNIEQYSFYNCHSLKHCLIASTQNTINAYTYYNCKNISAIDIPNEISVISEGAFMGCEKVYKITIPTNTEILEKQAFANCNNLNEISFENNPIINISFNTFLNCNNLSLINVSKSNNNYMSAGNCLIKKLNSSIILGCKNSIIPSDGSVKRIENYSFYSCYGLTEITIPNDVQYIGQAFSHCKNLKTIHFEKESMLNEIAISAFYGCINLELVIIPKNLLKISSYSFYNCSKAVFYCEVGNKPNTWEGGWNFNRPVYWFSETQPAENGNYWHYDIDGKTPVIWERAEVI